MSHYPKPVLPPKHVIKERRERVRQLIVSCALGIGVRLLIILGEFVGVMLFGSSALLMDALSSLVDVVSSLVLVVSLKFAARPPDQNHPFGHGRFEPLVGLQLGLLMACIGGGMIFQQTFALTSIPESHYIDSRAWWIPFCAIILLEISYRFVMRVAKKQESPALAADAIHYRIDGITSLFAMIALIVAAYFPETSGIIDHLGAIFIAIFMIGVGFYAARENLNQILDRTPKKEYFERVSRAARSVDGVLGTEKIRLQMYGPNAHVDIDVEVDPHLSVDVAHEISQRVRVEIQKEWPAVQDVTVHIEPFYPNDH